jgi:hypothetical protein
LLSLQRRPIAWLLIVATISAQVSGLSIKTLTIQRKADSAALTVAERNLEHVAKLLRLSAELQSQFARSTT